MDLSKKHRHRSRSRRGSSPDIALTEAQSLNRSFIISTIEKYFPSSSSHVINAEAAKKIDTFLSDAADTKSAETSSSASALIVHFSFSRHLDFELIADVKRSPLSNGTTTAGNQKILVFFRLLQPCAGDSRTIIRWVTDDEAVDHLRQLLSASSELPNDQVVELYKQLERFVDRPKVLQSLVAERSQFMQKLSDWSETLLEFTDAEEDDDDDESETSIEDHSITRIGEDLAAISKKVLTLKSREHLLNQVLSNSAVLFRDVPEAAEFRESLSQTIQMLHDEAGQLYVRWQSGASGSIQYDLTRPCIVIDETSQLPRITFSFQLERFAANAGRLREYGFRIPAEIEVIEKHVTKYIDLVRELRAIVKFYCTVADRILLCQRPLLIDKAKAFTNLLESNQKLTWSDGIETINAWIAQLKHFKDAFLRENDQLRGRHQNVLELILPIIDTSFVSWSNTIARVKVIMEELDHKYHHRNTLSWRKHWDYQLYKILEYYFNCLAVEPKRAASHQMAYPTQFKDLNRQQQQLLFFDSDQSTSLLGIQDSATTTIELQFNSSGYPEFEPSLEHLKQSIFGQLDRFIRFPSHFHAFVDWSLDRRLNPSITRHNSQSEQPDSGINLDSLESSLNSGSIAKRTLFHNIYYRNSEKFPLVYQKAVDAIEELVEIRGRFRQWCSLYHLIRKVKLEAYESADSSNAASTFTCRTLEQYQHNLSLIKDLSAKFHRQFYSLNEIACQHSQYVVNILPIKMFIKWLLGETEQVLLRLFRDQTQREIEAIELRCRESAEKLKQKPESIDELIELDHFANETLPKTREALLVDSVTLKEKMHFYKSWAKDASSLQSMPKIEATSALLKEFENNFESRSELMGQYRESLEARTSEQMKLVVAEVNSFLKRWNELSDSLKRSPEIISDFQINCNELMVSVGQLSRGCTYFGLSAPSTFSQIESISTEIQDLYAKFHVLYEFEQGLSLYLEMEWIVCRNKLPKINQYIGDWLEKKDGPTDDVLLRSHLDSWKKLLAILELCRGDFYQQLHWNQLLALLDIDRSYEDLKLNDLALKKETLKEKRSAILELNKRAFNDYSLRETLHELDQFALNGKFILYSYQTKENKEVMLIKDWSSCFNQISDCFLLVQTVRNIENNADGTVSEEYLHAYQEWETKLTRLEALLQMLNSVQRKWISLEPIYHGAQSGSGAQSGASAASFFNDLTFSKYSNDFQDLMRSMHQLHGSQLIRLLSLTNLEGRLKAIDQNFAQTQKKLRTFIEESRQRFPRFYFLADEDLLLILSGKVDLNQSALVKKLFVNTIGRLIYGGKSAQGEGSHDGVIEAIESVQGEVIRLRKKIKTDNTNGPLGIENWLKQLDAEIRSTLEFLYQENLSQIRSFYCSETLWAAVPSQLLSVFAWIDFTEKVEDAMRKHALSELKFDYERIITRLTRSAESDFAEKLLKATIEEAKFGAVRGAGYDQTNHEHLCKLKIKQVVLDVIHFINVIESLIENEVRDLNHWSWQSQLRFYPKATAETNATKRPITPSSASNRGVEIQMGLASFDYTFEYLGCLGDSKLVHTDLTNKCFLTMTQAMDLGLGGNPYGPAGTGKTESVKALGHHFGRQVLVFNCDEAIDVKSMTRILVGLIKCGSWGCFDEFNRLQLDVLSVLSSQIQEIQNSIKARSKFALLTEYGQVEINSNAAIFITLNPAGKEYGGRNRIPDNLKSLFLPVAMTSPDNRAIVRFLLLAEGFTDTTAKVLGEKVTAWFELASGSMSKQKHYDWGLRAIKACLEAAGRRLHSYPSMVHVNEMAHKEVQLVVDTLRQQIKSKLVDEDVSKFDALLEAAFGVEFAKKMSVTGENDAEMDSFHQAVLKAIKEFNLVASEYQISKIYQLHEQIQTRFGIVMIGPSGAGKTTTWRCLRKALEILDSPADTKQTSTKINAIVINPKSLVPKSKLFGYIDEDTREWHDGLFSIKARELLRSSDEEASGSGVNEKSTVMHWMIFDGDIDPDWVEALNSVLDDNRVLTLPSGERIDFDLSRCRIMFETTSLANASPATISRLGVVSIDSPDVISQVVQCFVATNQLPANSFNTVQTFLRTNQATMISPLSATKTLLGHLHYSMVNQESENTALDRMTGGTNRRMGRRKSTYAEDSAAESINNLIQTDTISRCVEMLRPLLSQHICLIGPVCSGKTTLVTEYVLASSAAAHLLTIDCTPSTDAATLTSAIFAASTIMSNVVRPQSSSADHFCIFVRHFELLQYDKWSSNSLTALLVFLLRYSGFYHPDNFEWLQLERFQLIVTCTDVELLDKRLLSSMHLVQIDRPNLDELSLVLSSKAKKINEKLLSWFPHKYSQLLDLISRMSSISSAETSLNPLKVGIDILESLQHYDDALMNETAVDYELSRTLKNYITGSAEQHRVLPDSAANVFTSLSGSVNYAFIDLESFKTQIGKWLRTYTSENDLALPTVELLPQTLSLIAELCSFMADTQASEVTSKTTEKADIKSLVVVGNRGAGRKYFVKMIAHVFGYDKVWSPNQITSERHLVNELKGLLNADEAAGGQDSSEKVKLLLLIDQIHFDILPYLRDKIFAQLYSRPIGANVSIRLVITTNRLTPTDALIWLRQARLHRIEPLSEPDFTRLTDSLISGALAENKRLLEQTRPILPLFYQVYCHFCVKSEAASHDPKTNLYLYNGFVKTYLKLLLSKMSTLGDEGERLSLGVDKLNQVSSQVNQLKEEALEQKKLLDAKRAEADEAFQMIMNSMHQSEDKRTELEDVQGKIEVESKNLKERKAKIDEELASIEPILQTAKAAVGGIQSSALAEIRSLRAPPEVIRDILEGVLRLMGIKDTSWVSMKTFLSRKGMNEIMNFDCRRITPEILAKVEQLLAQRSESFQPANAKRASVAAASLAEWVKANVDYTRVLLKIDPLEKELAKLESGLVRAQSRLKTLNLQLEGVDTEVEALRTRMQAVTVEAAQIEINLANSTKVLEQSEALVGNLSGEHRRWAQKLKEIETDRAQQPIKCLITAAYITTACSEPSVSRRVEQLKECIRKYFSELQSDFNPTEFLSYNAEEEIFLKAALQQPIPLVCDPTHKAITFFEPNSFEQTRLSSKDWLKVLELSIRFGRTLVITDFVPETLDIRLIPLLFGSIYGTSETRFWTFLGDRKIDYNPSFRLYLLADNVSQSNSGSGSAASLFRLINLSPSFGSISTQLLHQIIAVKRPELEKERDKVESEVKSLKAQLTNLENELLENLNASQDDRILENAQLIDKLKFLKKSSAKIEESLKASDKLRADLEREHEQYAAVAQFAANMFFSIGGLERLCPMYYFGYQEFEQVFRRTLERYATDRNGPLTNDIVCYSVYRHISRALFAEHRRALWHYFLSNFSAEISGKTITNSGNESESIGEFIVETIKVNQSQVQVPPQVCLVVTSPGSDPTIEIETAVSGMDGFKLRIISMGNDVITQVTGLLNQPGSLAPAGNRQKNGGQVLCLANLHLVIGWLQTLSQLLSQPQPNQFTLVILITELSDNFPTTLLERCTKFAYESVPGIRAHLRRLKVASAGLKPIQTNSTIRPLSSTRTFEETSGSEQLFTLLEYFHAICCERRFYLPFGWTKNYEFSFNEFRFARHLLQKLLGRKFINNSGSGRSSTKDKQMLLFDYITGLFKDVIYGGKVDFPIDDHILNLLLKRCFDPEEKFQVDQKGQALSNGTINEFNLLGLPLNADSIRSKTIDERLKQHLQLLTASTSAESSGGRKSSEPEVGNAARNQPTVQTRFGVDYFQKLWKKILAKCKVSPSSAGERLFVDDDDFQASTVDAATNESVDYLHATEWKDFVRKFSKSQLNYAKKIMEQIDVDLKENETFGQSLVGVRSEGVDEKLRLNQAPDTWSNMWPSGPEMAQDYLITLARIYIKLNNLEQSFAAHSALASKVTFDMTACFHPKLFLNALKQFAARQLAVCVDQLKTYYIWNEGVASRRKSSVAVSAPSEDDETMLRMKLKLTGSNAKLINVTLSGISLEGATFVQDRLQTCNTDSPFISLMPTVNVVFLENKGISTGKSTFSSLSIVAIPLYTNSRRETLLTDRIDIPCSPGTEDRWCEMGVALVLGNWPN